jgi:hypothetical protein
MTVVVPERYNYVGVFLTLACNLSCSYCINRIGTLRHSGGQLSGEEWLSALNRLQTRSDLPITLQGGEPTLHPDFYRIVNGLRPDLAIDLLTNLQFEVEEFMARIDPNRLRRQAPYASIRVSFHPESMSLGPLMSKVVKLMAGGYSVGIWGVDHPLWHREIVRAGEECRAVGIDFRIKEFLGSHQGRWYGTYKYPDSCSGGTHSQVECRTSELLIGPDGRICRCHSDLYAGRSGVGNLLEPEFQVEDRFRACACYGECNPCDVKLKTDRFQKFGHTSVEIRLPSGPIARREETEQG